MFRVVVERDDSLGRRWRPPHVGGNAADSRVEFARMPLHLGDRAARLRPTSGLISEVRVGSSYLVRRTANRACEKIADAFLQEGVRRQPNGVFDPFAFEVSVDPGIGEARVSAEIHARDLAA